MKVYILDADFMLFLSFKAVKEKLESKPRQPTIDLSQMAVPIQMTQEKRHSPESPSIAVVESELVAEYITTGKWLRKCEGGFAVEV